MREVVAPALDGERLDRVAAMMSGRSRADIASLLASGAVRVDDAVVTKASTRLRSGAVVDLDLPEVAEVSRVAPDASIAVPIVYEDEHLFVVDKPAGLVVHPGAGTTAPTLVNGLLARDPGLAAVGDPARPGIVHRLDKGTSGLLLVARTPEAYGALVAMLQRRDVVRRYRALVWGHPGADAGLVDAPIGRSGREPTRMTVAVTGKAARTRYDVVARYVEPVEVAELLCHLETGRTHQIRVHLSSIGHAVVGDARYGGARQSLPSPRPWLHAEHLELAHPVTGAPLAFDAALPGDLEAVRAPLR